MLNPKKDNLENGFLKPEYHFEVGPKIVKICLISHRNWNNKENQTVEGIY